MRIKEVKLLRIACILICGCVIGFALLALVFCLPLSEIKDRQQTAEIFYQEGNRPATIPTYTGSVGDGYTDALMLAEALFEDEEISPLEQAVYVYRRANSVSMSVDFADMLEGKDMQWEIEYSRYWHGFLVFLRPMLMMFSYADVRMLICAAQMLLFALMLGVMIKKGNEELIVPFIAVILTLSPMGTMLSMQYFSSYVLMMLGMLGVLLLDERLAQGAGYFYFFLLLGMLTCYFDFLTYPLVTLCVPLILVVYKHREERGMWTFAMIAGIMWCVGYLGLWGLKWVIGSLLVQENLIKNALYKVLFHTATKQENPVSRWEAIVQNVAVICRPGYFVLYLSCILACVARLSKGRRCVKKLISGNGPLLLALGLVPFAWWLLAAKHSIDHSFFTYRLISITVFSVLVWLISARKNDDKLSVKQNRR